MNAGSAAEAPVIVEWERAVGEILDRTAQFPKVVRFTFSQRIDGLALDVLQNLVEARYARGTSKEQALTRVSQGLVQLRVLLRLSHQRRFLDHRSYEALSRQLEGTGRKVGGWIRQQRRRGRL
ncbi:MAG: four helix bundle protein [Myxococcota bacterium]